MPTSMVTAETGSKQYISSSEEPDVRRVPPWSPDGRRILFYSQRTPNGDLSVMNADGSSPRNLTRNVAHDGGGSRGRRTDGRSRSTATEPAAATSSSSARMAPASASSRPARPNDSNPSWAAGRTQDRIHERARRQRRDYVMDANGGARVEHLEQPCIRRSRDLVAGRLLDRFHAPRQGPRCRLCS